MLNEIRKKNSTKKEFALYLKAGDRIRAIKDRNILGRVVYDYALVAPHLAIQWDGSASTIQIAECKKNKLFELVPLEPASLKAGDIICLISQPMKRGKLIGADPDDTKNCWVRWDGCWDASLLAIKDLDLVSEKVSYHPLDTNREVLKHDDEITWVWWNNQKVVTEGPVFTNSAIHHIIRVRRYQDIIA